ncbi:MAG: hypothetical protein MHM6MM_006369, partial [Cercozoa sp. M6MM]
SVLASFQLVPWEESDEVACLSSVGTPTAELDDTLQFDLTTGGTTLDDTCVSGAIGPSQRRGN